ncbi:hypothetical protein GGS21DRAFT_537552 [Xylaria nigripes]|nr:hypothetical protein GGS21DRAFT_537552 [Xylaria nigripes]
MDNRASIASWIHTLPEYTGPRLKESRKRKLAHQQQLTSSPALPEGTEKDGCQPEPKKICPINIPDVAELDGVPGHAHASASISDASPMNSGVLSPKRQMLSLRLKESGVEFKPLNVNRPPQPAIHLVRTMARIGRLFEILPHALESTIMKQVETRNMDYREWIHSFKSPEVVDTLPGRVPTFEEIENVYKKASECQEYSHEEVSWNHQVYMRLLESIFENFPDGQCDEFNVMSCTAARPHRQFKPIPSPTDMIDMCIYASFNEDVELSARIHEFSRVTPTRTVNHTDFLPISMRPLLLSIETKKLGVHWETAQLQIGIWHAAQWSFLRWAVSQKVAKQHTDEKKETTQTREQQDKLKTSELAILSKLGFIPGVIVQGHQWYLVLSTYEDGKTILWTHRLFGTTQSPLETYAVVAGIRELTAWARDFYLPWFEANVLD